MYVELDPAIVEDVAGALEVVDGEAPSRAVRGQLLLSTEGDGDVFIADEVVVLFDGREEVVPLDDSSKAFGKALAKGWLRGLPGIPSQVPKALVPRPQNRARESRPRRRTAGRSSSSGGGDPPDGDPDEPPSVEPSATRIRVARLGVAYRGKPVEAIG